VTIREVMHGLQGLPLSTAIAESTWLFPTLETLHVVAIGLVVGTILFVDLRLLGLTWRRDDVRAIAGALLPWTWAAFGFAVLTGALMFLSNAVRYSGNPAFIAKLVLLAMAGLNMALFHAGVFRTVEQWRTTLPTPAPARAAASMSLVLWVAIVGCGRWVGFL
jgi:hypothetical protein